MNYVSEDGWMMDLRAMTKQNMVLGIVVTILLIILFIFNFPVLARSGESSIAKEPDLKLVSGKATATPIPAKEVVQTFQLNPGKAPEDNPLKGFVGLAGTAGYSDFPSSMEYILLPMSSLVVGKDTYDWTELEEQLQIVNAYGRQAVISLYLDYPGSSIGKNAIPKYLLDKGLTVYPYDRYKGGYSPDYSDKDLWDMVYKFVAAFAKEYDGDGRIGGIEASIIGIWGEWHTHPFTNFGLKTSDLVELARVYDREFKYTQVAYRYPFDGMQELRGGYSDYSFTFQSIIDEWSQLTKLKQTNMTDVWKKYMCGGELYPQHRDEIFETEDWCMREGESYVECIEALHPSWLLVGNLTTFTMEERKEAIKAANMLGYEYYISEVSYDPYIEKSIKKMNLSVTIQNNGNAPFYYDWPVTLEFIDSSGVVKLEQMQIWDITTIAADGKDYKFSTTVDISSLKKGVYQIALRIKNPLSNGNPIRFANETQHKDGLMMIGQFGYGTYAKFTKSLAEVDANQTLEDKCGWSITSSYLRDHISYDSPYVFGLRFRKLVADAKTIDYNMIIYLYKDSKLVKTIYTTWNLKDVKGDTVYLSWASKIVNPGEYVMKLKVSKDIAPIDFGHVIVVKK